MHHIWIGLVSRTLGWPDGGHFKRLPRFSVQTTQRGSLKASLLTLGPHPQMWPNQPPPPSSRGRAAVVETVVQPRPARPTMGLRVLRKWLKGPRQGETDVFIDALPGFPDGISRSADGNFWLCIVVCAHARVCPQYKEPILLILFPENQPAVVTSIWGLFIFGIH